MRTLIPKIAEGIFTVICKFNATNEYVLYYHSGRKTLRVFRARDGVMIANYRVPSDLSSLESTTDGYSVVLGKSKLFQNSVRECVSTGTQTRRSLGHHLLHLLILRLLRCFETQGSPGCTCTSRSKFLTHSLFS